MRFWCLVTGFLMPFCGLCATVECHDTQTTVFDPSFATLRVMAGYDDQSVPVMTLDSEEHITVSFDEFSDSRSYLRYSLVHCNRFWCPDGLVDSEFLAGFNEGEVEEYSFSKGTLCHYIHYTVTLPNNRIQFTASGNYLLKVYDESDPDVILLQARFCVSEANFKTTAVVSAHTDIDHYETHQQLEIAVDAPATGNVDFYRDITVAVDQNRRLDNNVYLSAPLRVTGNRAIYSHNKSLIFEAGNEFRRFETVNTTYPGMGVDYIDRSPHGYRFILEPSLPKAASQYRYDSTQFGRYRIRETSAVDSDVEADYSDVSFCLKMPPLYGGDIYLSGDLTLNRFDDSSRMVYDNDSNGYTISLPLKQGHYNYQYIYVPTGCEKGTMSYIDGNKFQTVNEYNIRVYRSIPGERYDRLVSVSRVYSDY